jgi:ERCC4 domain-containing protein/Lsr2 protein
MPDDFVIARNPDPESTLPYLVRVPLGPLGVVLKVRDTWPRTSKVYCHRAEAWPDRLEIVERVPVRSCVRRGGAIDLVLDRGRENRSQFVFTRIRGGREAIFWQSARTAKQARPNVALPHARAAGLATVEIVVDSHERYAWSFSHQQATTVRRALPAGDYAVESDGEVVASVERKNLQDLVASLTSGKLRFALAELSGLPRAAVVVEARYSEVFKLEFVRPTVVVEALAECQVRWPTVPIVFAETRPLAQEWAFRFLGAALAAWHDDAGGAAAEADLVQAGLLSPGDPVRRVRARDADPATSTGTATAAEVRQWAREQGIEVSERGTVRAVVREAYERHHP